MRGRFSVEPKVYAQTRSISMSGSRYGAFHAAGPGHRKAVISAYLVANDEPCAAA